MITRVVRPESHNHLWAEEGEGGSVPDTQTKCTASYFVGPKKRDAGCSDAADLCLRLVFNPCSVPRTWRHLPVLETPSSSLWDFGRDWFASLATSVWPGPQMLICPRCFSVASLVSLCTGPRFQAPPAPRLSPRRPPSASPLAPRTPRGFLTSDGTARPTANHRPPTMACTASSVPDLYWWHRHSSSPPRQSPWRHLPS